jgi:hypothetical protein
MALAAALDRMRTLDMEHVRCNCWPFVQTSVSVLSTPMTGA